MQQKMVFGLPLMVAMYLKFDASINASTLNALINNTPGVVEHGIFHQLTDLVLIAQDGVVSER